VSKEWTKAIPDGMTLDQLQAEIIIEFLARNRGNRSRTAKELGLHVSTIRRLIARIRIEEAHEKSVEK
jgi:DNA-binding NtrC family response regulator